MKSPEMTIALLSLFDRIQRPVCGGNLVKSPEIIPPRSSGVDAFRGVERDEELCSL